MADLHEAFNKEADVLPKKQKQRGFYTYLVVETDEASKTSYLRGEFRSRGEVARFLQDKINRLGVFKVYKSVGTVGLKEKRTVEFEL